MAQENEAPLVTITLTFRVEDVQLLTRRANEAMREHGAGVEPDGTLQQAVVEVLLHSNPAVESYDLYGLALLQE
jgi:hypothetical protein